MKCRQCGCEVGQGCTGHADIVDVYKVEEDGSRIRFDKAKILCSYCKEEDKKKDRYEDTPRPWGYRRHLV